MNYNANIWGLTNTNVNIENKWFLIAFGKILYMKYDDEVIWSILEGTHPRTLYITLITLRAFQSVILEN